MAEPFYILLRANEDDQFITLHGYRLTEFLNDPEAYAGITDFKDAAFLRAEPDPYYWPEGVGVLLKCEAVVPQPSGKYRIP